MYCSLIMMATRKVLTVFFVNIIRLYLEKKEFHALESTNNSELKLFMLMFSVLKFILKPLVFCVVSR